MNGEINVRCTMCDVRFLKFVLFIFNFSPKKIGTTLCFAFLIFNSHAQSLSANAGNDTGVCQGGDSITIGGNPAATGGTAPYTYSWQPTAGLDFPNSSNPKCFPSSPLTYTLTVTDGTGNSSVDVVNVTIYTLPIVSASADQTIIEGTNTQLFASGAVNYYWTPTQTLYNQNTASPFAEPGDSTTYCVIGVDENGCGNFDCMIVYVIPSDELVIYNCFTPNEDGQNDFFHIGNIQKYPQSNIEVFNRNGKLVFHASPYLNDWNGKVDNLELPCATYYYVLAPGNGKSKMQGAVTIIR